MRDVRDTVARPSLDTYYQVNFSFGNFDKWLTSSKRDDGPDSKKRTQARGFQRKMSLLCTQAEIPGAPWALCGKETASICAGIHYAFAAAW